MLNSHYSGRFKNFITKLHEKAPAKFYEILNSHNFYDVKDENNSLTPEQRASIRPENQSRMSDFSKAFADMLLWFMGDDDEGLVTKSVQETVDKLDVRASANAAKVDTIGNSISAIAQGPLAPLQGINLAQQIAGSQVAAAMGTSIFDPDLIPPVNFGINFSLPADVANIYKSGFFRPDWKFLYDKEFKSNRFYYTQDGGLKIGTGIDLGAAPSELWLKRIFSVTSVSKDLTPIGDPIGGVSESDYTTLIKAKGYGIKTESNDPFIGLSDPVISNFSLNDGQVMTSFYKYVDANLWEPINNRRNWVNGHWGALGHNSCPSSVRTAVCSFIWDTGLALEPNKSDEAALISYCLQMGMYYLTGFKYKVRMTGIEGVNTVPAGQTLNPGETKIIQGVPKNKNIANTYFTWIADILVRTTHNINGDTIALDKRKRRIEEANLIYGYLGMPLIDFGKPLSDLPYLHSTAGLKDRKFDKLIEASIFRYANEGAPGGSGSGHSINEPTTSNIVINYIQTVDKSSISAYTLKVIKFLFSQAGITSLTITSSARTPKDQARVMFNNLERGNRIEYKEPGQEVVNIYDVEKPKGTSDADIKNAMENKIKNLYPRLVSRHTIEPTFVNVIDIAPNSLKPGNKSKLLEEVLDDNTGPGKLLDQFLGPGVDRGNDPAYHLVIPQDDQSSQLEFTNDALPDVSFTLKNNTNFKFSNAWLVPLAKDRLMNDTLDASK